MRPGVLLVCVLAACQFSGRSSTDDGSTAPVIDSPPGTIDGAHVIDASRPDATPPPPDAMVDARRACPSPPAGCTAFDCGASSCYIVCAATDWVSAASRCAGAGGCLATIDDATENTCIAVATLPNFPDLVWFGFVQAPGGSEPAGGWGWQCGASSFLAGNWGSFEPNNGGGNEDCGAMGNAGAWIDGDCATHLRYVCEIVP